MNLERMDPEELLEEFWKASNPEQEKRETKRPTKLSTKMRLPLAIVLSLPPLTCACLWTVVLVYLPCLDAFPSSPCESYMFMRHKWDVLSAWVIAGVLVILLLMWAIRARRGGA